MFMSALPTRSKSAGTDKKNNLALSLRPCPDENGAKTWYRFRLLAFSSPSKSDRDYPFIERYTHQVFEKNEKGFNVLKDEITCPVTKWVNFEGNRYDGCPMCKIANQYFNAYKESGWRDRSAAAQNRLLGRKYQAIVPVYVVNDPNYPSNNGRFKVIIFSDKKVYTEFCEKIKAVSATNCVFNSENAVDCCIHVSDQITIMNQGQPNEYEFKQRVIDKITFSSKPYTIEAITKDRVENMGFDETYYVASTVQELNEFYSKHFKMSNDDIPEDDDIPVFTPPKQNTKPSTKQTKKQQVELKNTVTPPVDDDISDDTDVLDDIDLVTDPEDLPVNTPTETSDDDDDVNIDDLISGLDF